MNRWLLVLILVGGVVAVGWGVRIFVAEPNPYVVSKEEVTRFINGDREKIPKGRLGRYRRLRQQINEDFEDPESTVEKIRQLQAKPSAQLTEDEQIYIYMSEAMVSLSLESFGEVLEGISAETKAETDDFYNGLEIPEDFDAEQPANVTRIDQVNDLEFEQYIADPDNYFKECFKLLPEGKPDFGLTIGMQSGVYDLFLQWNPGEPGKVGIKLMDAIRERPVAIRLVDNANPHEFPDDETNPQYDAAWSEDLSQYPQRIYELTVLEGSRGRPFPARIEVWFTPEGAAEGDKRMERTFFVEGWEG